MYVSATSLYRFLWVDDTEDTIGNIVYNSGDKKIVYKYYCISNTAEPYV
jgi:hypothetical protein